MIKKIVEYLRSGKYVRHTRTLHGGANRRCAIGVMCEAVGIMPEYNPNTFLYTYEGQLALPPASLRTKLPRIDFDLIMVDNDSGHCFETIAERLESGFYGEVDCCSEERKVQAGLHPS